MKTLHGRQCKPERGSRPLHQIEGDDATVAAVTVAMQVGNLSH